MERLARRSSSAGERLMIRMEVVSDADTIAWDEQEETTTCTPPDHHKKNRWSCIPANKYSRGPSRWEKPT